MVLMFADDTIILSTTKEGLQKEMDHMCDFCEKLKLMVYSNKTKVTVEKIIGKTTPQIS